MAIKKEMLNAISEQKNDFDTTQNKESHSEKVFVDIPAPLVKETNKIKVNAGSKGRPSSLAGNERVRISLYISGELNDRIESLLDKNIENKNQLCTRLLQIGCQALRQQKILEEKS